VLEGRAPAAARHSPPGTRTSSSAAQRSNALPIQATGREIYEAACTTCHGPDGTGAPRSVVGFDRPLPDFTDCAFATAEPDPDWFAVVHEGGPIRGLGRQMPAFGDALSRDEITRVLGYVRTFCDGSGWPRGDLNFPRAFFTEKAFPENEIVWTTGVTTGGETEVASRLVYERRVGARWQIEAIVPIDVRPGASGDSVAGLGDVVVGAKHALFSTLSTGSIVSAGIEVALPTGSEADGLGNGYTVFEPFAMWGQVLPRNSFVQVHGGVEIPSEASRGVKEAFVHTAIGTTLAQDRGYGRSWSPQVELLWARPFGESSEWDVVPEVQVSLSKLQHVLVAVGVRVPLTDRDVRRPQILAYVLWDWFDGSLFNYWK
jgi:mono/diheme cytochrome c family protein